MHIVMGDEYIDELRERHLVLQLETFEASYSASLKKVTAYCVVPQEAIPLQEMPHIERLSAIHQAVVDAWNKQDYRTVENGIEHLKGHFNGELDSFYDILLDRIKELNVQK
jgi:hypothetical protein